MIYIDISPHISYHGIKHIYILSKTLLLKGEGERGRTSDCVMFRQKGVDSDYGWSQMGEVSKASKYWLRKMFITATREHVFVLDSTILVYRMIHFQYCITFFGYRIIPFVLDNNFVVAIDGPFFGDCAVPSFNSGRTFLHSLYKLKNLLPLKPEYLFVTVVSNLT